jgi:hypothetical protein
MENVGYNNSAPSSNQGWAEKHRQTEELQENQRETAIQGKCGFFLFF